MGQRTDDLEPRDNDYESSFERSQDIAGRNAEEMRERLGPGSDIPPDDVIVSRSEFIVEGQDAPVEEVIIPEDTNDTDYAVGTRNARNTGDAGDTGNDNGDNSRNESTDEIRGDIEDTRARMGSTIDAIQEKLSPQRLMEQAKETARDATIGRAQDMASNVADTARETGSTIMDTIRDNPVPVALTAIGLGWLIWGARRKATERRDERDYWNARYGRYGRYDQYGGYDDRYRNRMYQGQQDNGRVGQMADKVQDTASRVGDQIQNTANKVGDQVQGMASNAADRAGDAADYAQWQAQRARSWLEQTWDDNPLLVAGAALAAGTIIGLSLPETPMENKLMGDARDNLVEKAQGLAEDTVQKAQSAANKATNQVQNQAQQQRQQQQQQQQSATNQQTKH